MNGWQVEWLQRCDWDRHTRIFNDELVVRNGSVAMELHPHVVYGMDAVLWDAWAWARSQHPNVLALIKPGRLRFAALDWTQHRISVRREPELTTAVRWACTLVDIYDLLARRPHELGWFANPWVFVDLAGNVRLGFADPTHRRSGVPPEHRASFPVSDERGAIYIVGTALAKLVRAPRRSWLAQIIARCTAPDREARFTSFTALRGELATLDALALQPNFRDTWPIVERAIGWLSVDDIPRALLALGDALVLDPACPEAIRCHLEVRIRLGVDQLTPELIAKLVAVAPEPPRSTTTPSISSSWGPSTIPWSGSASREDESSEALRWADVASQGAELEAARDFGAALALYRTVRRPYVATETAMARCSVELGNLTTAVGHARRALALVPAHLEAIHILCRSLARNGENAAALVETERWLELAADDANAHYSRGKCLLGLGRLVDARAAFDRALVLDGQLVEALLLRREVDRMTKTLRATVGTAQPELEVPEHLTALRPLLAAGNFAAAIDQLLAPDHARDVAAQLLLAGLVSSLRRNDEVIAICDRVLALDPPNAAARVTKAYALLDLQRASEALELFEAVGSAAVEATAGRARCLLELGRETEARAAFDEYVRMSAHGAELRLHSGRR